jgi:hypothetical protein
VLDTFAEQARERHLQISVHDPQVAKLLTQNAADGRLVDTSADYLMVVDANVGATKGDYFASKAMTVKTEVYASGMARHQVTLDYRLPAFSDDLTRALNPGDGTYRDFVRLYLPEQAAIAGFRLTVDGRLQASAPTTVDIEHGRKVVGALMLLPPAHQAVIDLVYELPLESERSYQFYVQKQAGSIGLPATFSITYPGGRDDRQLRLERDQQLSYTW